MDRSITIIAFLPLFLGCVGLPTGATLGYARNDVEKGSGLDHDAFYGEIHLPIRWWSTGPQEGNRDAGLASARNLEDYYNEFVGPPQDGQQAEDAESTGTEIGEEDLQTLFIYWKEMTAALAAIVALLFRKQLFKGGQYIIRRMRKNGQNRDRGNDGVPG